MPDLDIAGVVRTLNAHGVRYVVIGGVAAMVHNSRSQRPSTSTSPPHETRRTSSASRRRSTPWRPAC
ncbi:MAG TPA: hypothetical protein VG034_04105 [Acidimicrobiia bacterium]|nr:hypothetical protein [Acidimicrobiia bacterium]